MTTIAIHHQPFTLATRVGRNATKLTLRMHGDVVRTGTIPKTLDFLRAHYPQVLHTKCFNDHHQSFRKEVKDTEIGHLFEHIVLSVLCEQHAESVYRGWTEWNWKKESRGTFHISLSVGREEQKDLQVAIHFATNLITRLLHTQVDGWVTQPSTIVH